MDRTRINELLKVMNHVAVLIGLVLIFWEIRQNNLVTRAALIDAGFERLAETERAFVDDGMANVSVKALTAPGDLTTEERALFNNRLEQLLRLYRREQVFVELGIYREWESIVFTTAPTYFGNDYGRAYWAERGLTNPGIVAAMNGILTDPRAEFSYLDLDTRIVERLKQQNSNPQ